MPKPNPRSQARKGGRECPVYELHTHFGIAAPVRAMAAPTTATPTAAPPEATHSPERRTDEVGAGAGTGAGAGSTRRSRPVAGGPAAVAAARAAATLDHFACRKCGATFGSVAQQRAHYKTDWHVENLRRVMKGLTVLSEAEAAAEAKAAATDDVDDVSSDDAAAYSSDTSGSADTEDEDVTATPKRPHIQVTADGHTLKLWQVVLPLDTPVRDGCAAAPSDLAAVSPHDVWIVILFRSGHFAAAAFRGGTVVAHKCFHRYTVRKKQGGAQSSRDNSGGGKPRSVGSSMRRANEVALRLDIYGLLRAWKEHLDVATHIFLSCAKMHLPLFFAEESALRKDDARIRKVPFMTKRPKFAEVKRVYAELSTVELQPTTAPAATGTTRE